MWQQTQGLTNTTDPYVFNWDSGQPTPDTSPFNSIQVEAGHIQ